MFENWGFLLGEIWVLLLLAALLGLFAGWLIWRRSGGAAVDNSDEVAAKNRRIAELEGQVELRQNKMVAVEGDLSNRDAQIVRLERDLADCRGRHLAATARPAPVAAPVPAPDPEPAPTPEPTPEPAPEPAPDVEADAPLRLDGPRGGVADDLKRIRGIGPQMQALCNSLGFYHFDQIGSWSDAEVAWVDQNLKGFQGRVVRDQWVAQAQQLARGEDTEFSKRVDKGDVPSSQ